MNLQLLRINIILTFPIYAFTAFYLQFKLFILNGKRKGRPMKFS